MYLWHTSQTTLLGADAGHTGSDSNIFIKTILTLEVAKQSTSRPGEVKITKSREAKIDNRVVESPDRSSDFVANILATSKNATRLVLYQLWHAGIRHVNPKRLRSLFQQDTGLEQVNLSFFERFNCTRCNFSNMT